MPAKTAIPMAIALTLCLTCPALAGSSIVDQWDQAVPPAVPTIEPVTVNAADTALLVLDMEERTCNAERRPRCLETVPRIAALLRHARTNGMFVAHSQISSPTPILAEVTPAPGEPVVSSGVDKFRNTDLESILAGRGIKTVIVTGTAAHGAVLHTATAAAQRGLKVIVPVDCLSAASLYTEQAAVWCLLDGPGTRRNITLTTSEAITIIKTEVKQ
jgi:nicotinamidase-related amidase